SGGDVDWHFFQAQADGRFIASIAYDYGPRFIDDDRLAEAELGDRAGHRLDGLVVVAWGVGVRSDVRNVAHFDVHRTYLRKISGQPLGRGATQPTNQPTNLSARLTSVPTRWVCVGHRKKPRISGPKPGLSAVRNVQRTRARPGGFGAAFVAFVGAFN